MLVHKNRSYLFTKGYDESKNALRENTTQFLDMF